MKQGWVGIATLCVLLGGSGVLAQSTASITGVVVDSDGGVIPGATVTVKNNATGESFTAITTGQGAFTVPSIITGTYTVVVSLEGFKAVVLENVVVNAGAPAAVRATLEVGGLTEQVIVQSNAELVQTASATVSTTLDTRQVMNLPLSSRNATDFMAFLPGVQTAAATRDSIISGLPQSTINMTLDGVNIQDNTNKTTDGFFAIVGPRLDAVEEITLSTAAQGAEGTGMGATQMRFVTRSGTNQFRGSVFHAYRSDELNANTWFNKRDGIDKAQLLLNQPGFNLGGPIVLPGFNGRNRAFFFVNYEELRQPGGQRRTRTVLHPLAQAGNFRYNTSQGVQQVNLFELAARSGHLATPDPIISRLLGDIRSATGTTGNLRDLGDPLFQEYSFENKTQALNRYPTVRVDYQATDKHRLTYSMNIQRFGGGFDTTNNRDPFFPGFPVAANQTSERRAMSGWLRSILSTNLVNELRVGYGGAPVVFGFDQFTADMWSGSNVNQGGYYLNWNSPTFITNPGPSATPSARDAYQRFVENTLNWQKGAHSVNMGGSFSTFDLWNDGQQIVPELRFDVVQADPAGAMFTAANFANASAPNLAAAQRLYNILTGRVSHILGQARVNEDTGQYEFLGLGRQRARQQQVSLWWQDQWRLKSNLTMNLGLRYEMQFPFVAGNDSYLTADIEDVFGVSGVGNLFKPNTLTGREPEFRQLRKGERPYPMDWNNVAPSFGLAWTPSAKGGFLHRLTGETGDMAIRGGYTRSYQRLGLGSFTGEVGDNPGVLLNVNRDSTNGNLGQLPLLFRDASRLTPADFPRTLAFPYHDVIGGDVTIFSPNLRVPTADTWQAGVQRAIGRSMSVEARYVGSRSDGNWRTNNYNEVNIIENGFLNEFKLAMTNLQNNIAAGRGASFAYMGPGTGTSPLPIFLGYFNGVGGANVNDPAAYASTRFRDTNYVNTLARFNPNPYQAADQLDADATQRSNALRAGLAANFLVANPHLLGNGTNQAGANVVENSERTTYHSMVLEFRRRPMNGLSFQSNYVFGRALESQFYSLRVDSPLVPNGGAEGDVTHAFKFNAVYELPFGQGQRFAGGVNSFANAFIGGWSVAGNARLQSGRLVEFGNVRLVGMDKDELQSMYKVRIDQGGRVWMLPQAVIDESVKAFNASATTLSGWGAQGPPSGKYIAPADSIDCIETIRGYGDCGTRSLVLTGPMFKQVDFSITKRVGLWGRSSAEFRVDILNALNSVNFVPVAMANIPTDQVNFNRSNGSSPDDYDVTELVTGNQARIVQLVSRIRW
jgi:hypothetical protein